MLFNRERFSIEILYTGISNIEMLYIDALYTLRNIIFFFIENLPQENCICLCIAIINCMSCIIKKCTIFYQKLCDGTYT